MQHYTGKIPKNHLFSIKIQILDNQYILYYTTVNLIKG